MRPDIEDILPLTPLQAGFLFHAIYDQVGPDPYVAQVSIVLDGPCDTAALRTAAETLLARHANLRVAFQYEDPEKPLQVVMRNVGLVWEERDLSAESAQSQAAALERLQVQERSRRFDVAQPPLL